MVLRNTPAYILNSFNRISKGSTESNSFLIEVPLQKNHEFDLVTLVSANIPNTIYNVSENNNNFEITIGNDVWLNVELQEGYYNSINLPFFLAEKISDITGLYCVIDLPDPFLEVDTRKFTFNIYKNENLEGLDFDAADIKIRFYENDFHRLIGFKFRYEPYIFSTDVEFFTQTGKISAKIVSNEVINLMSTHYLTLKTDICSNSGSSDSNHSTLARINVPRNIDFGATITYQMQDLISSSRTLENKTNSIFRFSLYDDKDRLVNLNGAEVSYEIYIYRYNDFYEMAKKDLLVKHINNLNP